METVVGRTLSRRPARDCDLRHRATASTALFPVGASRARRCRFVATLFVCVASCAVAVESHGQSVLPPAVQTLVDESEESFFDGDYENASRLIAEAEKWINSAANQRDLARIGVDHSFVKSMLAGLRAQIFQAKGEMGRARGALRHAEAILYNRRSAYVKRRIFPPVMWQYEAFLQFVRGDLTRPTPDFGLSADAKLPEGVRRWLDDTGKSTESIRAYRNAEATMSRPMAQPNQRTTTANRLEGRLFVSIARVRVLKSGPPTRQDISDAESFLERAHQSYSANPFWNWFIKQESFGEIPLTFKEIDGRAGGPDGKLMVKRLFAQTIHDWLGLELLKAELTAYREMVDEEALGKAVRTTEEQYDRVIGFLKSQYRANHPTVQQVQLSRARWYLALARSAEAKRETVLSWLQDCLLELGGVKDLGAVEMSHKMIAELSTRKLLLEADDEEKFLEPDDRKAHEQRIVEIMDAFEGITAAHRKPEKEPDEEPADPPDGAGMVDDRVDAPAEGQESAR